MKIAILRALNLGDLLCSIPAIKALRKSLPNSHITLIGLPWAKEFVGIFNHYFDDFIEFPGYFGLPEREFRAEGIIKFLKEVQNRQFDLAIQMQGNGSITNSLVSLFHAKTNAGFYPKEGFCPNKKTYLAYPDKLPEVLRMVKLMEFLGFPSTGNNLEFPQSKETDHPIIGGKYGCLHPGAKDKNKRCDLTKFSQVGSFLISQGFKLVITGLKEEKPLADKLESLFSNKAINLAGKTTLVNLANVIKHSKLLIANDTGVSHLADALNTPSVVIFKTSDPLRWAPLNNQLHRIVLPQPFYSTRKVISEAKLLLR